MHTVLVVGGAGQLGSAIISALESRRYIVLSPPHEVLDVRDRNACEYWVSRADAVVNCAAIHGVEPVEANPTLALEVNAAVPLACTAYGHEVPYIYISTDYVFNDTIHAVEFSLPNPANLYGSTKLVGEQVAGTLPHYAIVRVSWLFGGNRPCRARPGPDHVAAVAEALLANDEVTATKATRIAISPVPYVADLVVDHALPAAAEGHGGIFHAVASGVCSHWELARHIAHYVRADPALVVPGPPPVGLPKRLALVNTRVPAPDWKTAVYDAVQRLRKRVVTK